MASLQGKKILLGITGSIAAYKAAFFVRLLVKQGAEVRVIMTPAATSFVGPVTLSTLSKNPVITGLTEGNEWSNHVALGLWADAMIIAPATAHTIAKMAAGLADNMLQAVYLSARCPVFIAPAMDLDMWQHPATRHNVAKLVQFGHHLIQPDTGELASGLTGQGRMAEPEQLIRILEDFFAKRQSLKGKTVLITAGPTYEPIDPVRFIGNRSSGKMGIALAREAARRGATVELILGPSSQKMDHPAVHVTRVTTAEQMLQAAQTYFPQADITILAAAVADFRPEVTAPQKIKKQKGQDTLTLQLVKNPDIAATLAKDKKSGQLLIGFALETHDAIANAKKKLVAKGFDFIVLNDLQDPGAGFDHDTNKVRFLFKDNKAQEFQLKHKQQVAADIFDAIEDLTQSDP